MPYSTRKVMQCRWLTTKLYVPIIAGHCSSDGMMSPQIRRSHFCPMDQEARMGRVRRGRRRRCSQTREIAKTEKSEAAEHPTG